MEFTEQVCPLCKSDRVVLHRWYRLDELRQDWQSGFGFDPFHENVSVAELRQYLCQACELRFFFPLLCGDESFYENLSTRFSWYYEKDKWEFDAAIRFIGDKIEIKDILEIGCGYGHFLRRLRNRFKVRGLEFNPEAIAACQQLNLNVSRVDISAINDQFDLIAAFEVLEHIPDIYEFLQQMVRLLRSGGYLVIAIPDPDSYFVEAEKVLLDMPPHHVLSFSKKTLSAIADLFGMEQVLVLQEPLRFVHYKSYLSNFISAEPTIPVKTFFDKLFQRFGFDYERLFRVSERRLLDSMAATTYIMAKKELLGQTHMTVYRKP